MKQYTFPFKVLYVGPWSPNGKGGISEVINNYLHSFDNVSVFSTTPTSGKFLNALLFPFLIVRFIIVLHKGTYQVVHIHGSSYGSFFRKYTLMRIAKQISGAKVIYHIHSGAFKLFYESSGSFLKSCIRKALHKADGVVCLSQYWADFFRSEFDLRTVTIVNNMIPYPAVSSKETNHQKMHFLFLGRIGEMKGIFDLLKVISDNKHEFSKRIVLMIGGNGEVPRLLKFIKDHQLEGLVKYTGWVEGANKNRLLAESDVFILPSYYEGMPLSILEAMSYGLPIISTPVGGIPEIINNNGILIPPGDHDSLYNAIQYCIGHDINNMAQHSKKIVKPFYPKSVFNQLSKIYQELLKK